MPTEIQLPESVTLVVAISADGYIDEGPGFDQWTSPEDWAHFQSKLAQAGAIIMGRGTYEINQHRMTIDPNKPRIIRTHSPERYAAQPGLEFTTEQPKQILGNLAARGIGSVVVVGGAKVYEAFLKQGYVTDMYVTRETEKIQGSIQMPADFTLPFGHWIRSTRLNERGTRLQYYKRHAEG